MLCNLIRELQAKLRQIYDLQNQLSILMIFILHEDKVVRVIFPENLFLLKITQILQTNWRAPS